MVFFSSFFFDTLKVEKVVPDPAKSFKYSQPICFAYYLQINCSVFSCRLTISFSLGIICTCLRGRRLTCNLIKRSQEMHIAYSSRLVHPMFNSCRLLQNLLKILRKLHLKLIKFSGGFTKPTLGVTRNLPPLLYH